MRSAARSPEGAARSPEGTRRLERLVALAAALCLFLSSIEYLIPKPLPFLRVGLANLPLLIALDLFPVWHYLLLLALKIIGQSLIQGTLFSFVFLLSLVGSLASGLLMLAARRVFRSSISLIGTSILGALASNLSQLTLARYLVFGPSAWLVAPPFLVIGLLSSAVLGVFAEVYRSRSVWLRNVTRQLGG
jgi:heptaprenyl diphosphate synthase